MRYLSLLLTWFVCPLLFTACGPGGSSEDARQGEVTVDTEADEVAENEDTDTKDLVYLTFMNNEMQTVLGEIAEQKASSENVRSLATDLVNDNKQVAAKIEELAKAVQMQLPQGLEVAQQQKIDSLQKLPAGEFDKAFVNLMMEQQEKNSTLLEELAANGDNAIVRGLASDISEDRESQMERIEIVRKEMM